MAKNPNPKLSKAAQKRRKDIDNARRRYDRQAARYEKEAAQASGREAAVLRSAAESLRGRSDALKGVNARKRLTSEQNSLIRDSINYLASENRDPWKRGENLGLIRLSGSNLGHRFFALTEAIWTGTPYNGVGDMRRINKVRNAMSKNRDIALEYGRPNVNQMIEIIENLTDIDMESPYNIGDSLDDQMMQGNLDVIRNYG